MTVFNLESDSILFLLLFFFLFQGHNAKNILQGEISPNKNWLCEKGSPKAAVILQLERAAILTSIHVGNAYSAFVEILVGKAADSSDHFEVRQSTAPRYPTLK